MKQKPSPVPFSLAVRIGGASCAIAIREAAARRLTVRALIEAVLCAIEERMASDPLASATFPELSPWGSRTLNKAEVKAARKVSKKGAK